MDGADENKMLKKRSATKYWKLGNDYEITAKATPQQSHLAELGCDMLAS
jgi:hypothetical protein